MMNKLIMNKKKNIWYVDSGSECVIRVVVKYSL